MLTVEELANPGVVIQNPPCSATQKYVVRIKETGDTFVLSPADYESFHVCLYGIRKEVETLAKKRLEDLRNRFRV